MKAHKEGASGRATGSGTKRHLLGWLLGGSVVLIACLAIRQRWTAPRAGAGTIPAAARPVAREVAAGNQRRPVAKTPQDAQAAVVAVVNGESIRRAELGRACLLRFGTDVLERLVNKHLIVEACRRRHVTVTDRDVEAEIERMAGRFHLGKEQWLGMLEKERGITAAQYARDIVWPTLALRRLASQQLEVSKRELQEAYESQYGPAVRVRLIMVDSMPVARQVHAQLSARPADFVKLARKHSQDIGSASMGGLIPPVRRHTGEPEIERVVFGLKEGAISPVIRVGEKYAIFKCEGHIPARNVPMDQVADVLAEKIRDRKLRAAADAIFKQLQAEATVKNVLNDPVASRRMPGVAAVINGTPITVAKLAEECISRRGREVLAGEISRRLLGQALRKRKLQVTQTDIDREVARTAELAGVTDSAGRPDVAKWLQLVTTRQQVSREVYLQDSIWPIAALRKLTRGQVEVLDEDLRKGYEANYGPRVRCRAIVMSNLRRAQEVWDKARKNPSAEFFGDLAEQYSIEPTSRALRGEVPPIRKNSGQPILEREAFALKSHELSGVIQVGDKYVILLCEGRTEPVQVDMKEVRDLIREDVFEKKLRLAMDDMFTRLRDAARIDNYLAGTSHAPKPAGTVKPAGPAGVSRQLPAVSSAAGVPARSAVAARSAAPAR